MKSKTVQETAVVMAEFMLPQDTNAAGNVHGGSIMKLIDNAAGVVAHRHAMRSVVTASVDRIEFTKPVFVGDVVFLKASLNMASRTSMEIGVRVVAENPTTGYRRHTASAYLTFVALDEDGKPCPVPEVIPETEDEIRRNREAIERRQIRLTKRGVKPCSV